MAEGRRNQNNEPNSRKRCLSNLHYVVPNNLPESSNGKQFQESIPPFNPVNLVQYHNFVVGSPLWHHTQLPYNINYGSVLQPHISQNYFHRPAQEYQRNVQTSGRQNVEEKSVNSFRFWEQILSAQKWNQSFTFSVMCYNVLAQDLLDQHPYLYPFHSKKYLKWQWRWNNLFAEIDNFKPDILCLQEVQQSHLDIYYSKLEQLGYRGLYKQRTGARTDGCAIYYKHDLVNLVEYTTVEYNQPNISILDRDNVAIIAKFSPKDHPEREFVVATTHLLYNPRRQDVRLAQTQLLLTELDRIAFTPKGQYLPIIVTGDLNSTPDSMVYKLITRGQLRYENLARKSLERGTDGPKTGKKFLPISLRITDQCQHANLLQKRQDNAAISRTEEAALIKLKHSERNCDEVEEKDNNKLDRKLFFSGTLSHNLFLQSAYKHRVGHDLEATTFQDEWISVDYIFYSKPPNVDELRLVERYRLPTRNELGSIKIPNKDLGSDHLSLLAKFQLKV